jgi:tetratricopeptide (TPR) repeat protein
MRGTKAQGSGLVTICLGAILKDEDSFVEEWVAYHRLLGVDQFYLYDNDPRQPLKHILAQHAAYVTVRPWLIEHDDRNYPGRNKQLKAYAHCVECGADQFDWIAFIDGDEFIALEQHDNLKAFLSDFAGYDAIALNWHVFGHNGYYEDPSGLIIESLTRRMKEPRAQTKSITRPRAIASIDSAHRCELKPGRKCVDANKRPYRDDLYPGKTQIAHINHYQCRSFANWMCKPDRGEAGALAWDSANAWRFTREGCLRQFVREIALNKNEFVDTSMLRHVEPVKRYLSRLNANKGISEIEACVRGPSNVAPIKLPTRKASRREISKADRARLPRAMPLLQRRRLRRAIADAMVPSNEDNWPEAIRRWREILDEFGDHAPSIAFLKLSKACQRSGDLDAAQAIALEGFAKYPENLSLEAKCAEIAMARKRWPEAVVKLEAVLNRMNGYSPARIYLGLSRAYRHQGNLDNAEEVLAKGRIIHPVDIRLEKEQAKIAMVRKDWPEAIRRWRRILNVFGDKAPSNAFFELCKAYQHQGDLDAAETVVLEGLARHPKHAGLAVKRAEIALQHANSALGRKDWSEAATHWHAILDVNLDPKSAVDFRAVGKACLGLIRCNDYARVIPVVNDWKRREGETKAALAIEGLAYLRSSRTEEARAHWNRYWQRAKDDEHFARQSALTLALTGEPNRDHFLTLTRRDEYTAVGEDARFCVYTALFGEYDDLRSPAFLSPGVKFICFSDVKRNTPGWEVRIVDLDIESAGLKNRKIKILPYAYLNDYDCSLYIDANIAFSGDPLSLYRRWLKTESFVAWAHPQRSGVYEEIEANLVGLRHPPAPLIDQYEYFHSHGVPEHSGLIEASFLWRDHRDARVRKLMEQWWDFIVQYVGYRDQPALGYLMWKTGVRPALMPDYLGTSRRNEFFCRLPHRQTALELDRVNGARRCSVEEIVGRIKPTPGRRLTEPRLTWVYRNKFGAVASTLMRGHQLSEIARASLDSAQVNYVDEHQLGGERDSILILTKGFLKDATSDELAALKARGNIICADYVDDPEREDLHAGIDVYIAASIAQFVHFSGNYPKKLVHLITHHADPRIRPISGPEDYCNIGYFGEIANAAYASELQGVIDFCLTNTKTGDETWIPRLRHCNVHYAIRRQQLSGSFKPFLKGFTAAQCNSNIIVSLDESDTRYYLASDYPYLLPDNSLESVLGMIEYVRESFGSSEWHRGLNMMQSVRAKCDVKQVESEIRTLVAHYFKT